MSTFAPLIKTPSRGKNKHQQEEGRHRGRPAETRPANFQALFFRFWILEESEKISEREEMKWNIQTHFHFNIW